jgi:hypothetical protein
MKKIVEYFVKILFCILILTNCENNSSNTTNDTLQIVPLKIGNFWIYNGTTFDTNGNVNESKIYITKVESDSMWNGEKIFSLSDSVYNYKSSYYAFNRKDGYYYLLRFMDSLEREDTLEPLLIVKYPGKEGDSFKSGMTPYKIKNTDINYTTLIGTFKCYKYINTSDDGNERDTSYDYYSQGIGRIGYENFRHFTGGKKYLALKLELVGYSLK